MNILILGSSGKLGFELYNVLKKDKKNQIIHTGLIKKKKNLLIKKNLNKIITKNIDLLINCIALTNVDYCEKNKEKCYNINFKIVQNIFDIKKKKKIKFRTILFSTDQVYNSKKKSKENEKLKPLNCYSKSKILMEKLGANNETTIFRTNFFGKNKKKIISFSDWILKNHYSDITTKLAKDVIFNPLHITTLSEIIKKIVKNKTFFSGIYNLGSTSCISKSEMAIYFIKKLQIKDFKFVLKKMNEIVGVKRPTNMSMDINKFKLKFKISLPNVKQEIDKEVNLAKNDNWEKKD